MTEIFKYKFKNPDLLKQALTHPSLKNHKNYQTLEYLGDKILDFVIAQYLYAHYPNENEGDLSKRHMALVCGNEIAKIAINNGVNEKLLLSKGEENIDGRNNKSNLEDMMEAIFAAIYLDCRSIDTVKDIIINLWIEEIESFKTPPQDPKSLLQEYLQAKYHILPEYKTVKTEGPPHHPLFTMQLKIKDYPVIEVESHNKKEGEKELARIFMEERKND
jgi:ribonuclease III